MEDTTRTAELRRKLEKDPGSRLFAQFAEELRKENRHEEAIAVARKGLEKNPNYPSARLTLARSLLDTGRPGEARPELEQVVKASPDNILAGRLLGDALGSLGNLDAALQQYEKTLRLSPGDKGLTEKIQELKAKAAPPPTIDLRPAAKAASAPPALPQAFSAVATLKTAPEAPLPSAFEPPPEVPSAPAAVALDRDLASGTFSPGSLHVSDLGVGPPSSPGVESAGATMDVEMDKTVGFGELATASVPADTHALNSPPPAHALSLSEGSSSVSSELPAVDMPSEAADLGAQTLPLTSLTLADLYLQQGLKAEASAVLSQVIKEEPDNAQARSKLAAVSVELNQRSAEPAEHFHDTDTAAVKLPEGFRAPVGSAAAAPRPLRSKAEIRQRSILSLKALLSAVERESVAQRATERGAF